MDQILEGVEGTSGILDDMIITGKDDKEHLENLEEVLKRLVAYEQTASSASFSRRTSLTMDTK